MDRDERLPAHRAPLTRITGQRPVAQYVGSDGRPDPASRMTETHTLPAEPMSAAVARGVVAGVVPVDGEPAEIAVLLTSELVTNAVLHARTAAVLTVRCEDGVLRVEVGDGNQLVPVVKRYDRTAVTGRGLQLVSQLAHRWGVDVTPTGKVVWFELDLDGAPSGG